MGCLWECSVKTKVLSMIFILAIITQRNNLLGFLLYFHSICPLLYRRENVLKAPAVSYLPCVRGLARSEYQVNVWLQELKLPYVTEGAQISFCWLVCKYIPTDRRSGKQLGQPQPSNGTTSTYSDFLILLKVFLAKVFPLFCLLMSPQNLWRFSWFLWKGTTSQWSEVN